MLWKLSVLAAVVAVWIKLGPVPALLVLAGSVGGVAIGTLLRNKLVQAWKDSPDERRQVWAVEHLAARGDIGPALQNLGRKGRVGIAVMVILQERNDPRVAEAAARLLDD